MSPAPRALGATASAVAAAILTFLAWPAPAHPGGDRPPGTGHVVRTVDGDTLVVELGTATETVRLIGIDTPETVAPGRPVECFGPEASAHLAALVPPGTEVRLTRDVEPRDRYDRLLAYVERTADGLSVNAAVLDAGFAGARHYPPNVAHRARFDEAERRARRAGAGLWGACGGPHVAAPDSAG
ncbi:MAG TPA: thermonuclease family protein [Acidimicrobiales bacterium]|nr:thermonuclease family protein [Acidimicrobiales bacterium]